MFDKLKQLGELKRMRDQAMQIQRQLSAEEVVVEEQGVRVVMSGEQKIKELTIRGVADKTLIDVINKAVKKSQEVAAKKLQQISGGLSGLLGKI